MNKLLSEHCLDCHSSEEKEAGIDLQELAEHYDPQADEKKWIRVERVIASRQMPPSGSGRLADREMDVVKKWFDSDFVLPGGMMRAGSTVPRKLTREELQNTLEDILGVEIRQTVTNSRLHVIPDTIIEKFFPEGIRGESGFSNDASSQARESTDIQTLARCFSMVLSLLDRDEAARRRLLGSLEPNRISSRQAEKIISDFGARAFRRPLLAEEVNSFVKVFETIQQSDSKWEALKSSFLAILMSPAFLYRLEEKTEQQGPVSAEELAVRLSYFLWSAPPDDELMALARSRKLLEEETLRTQVRRMLADPRRIALAENLGGEWFDYKQLRQKSALNKRSDRMAGFYRTQFEEALLFFDSIIRYRQSLLRLVDSDWAFLNRHQAGIYRIQYTRKQLSVIEPLPPIQLHYRTLDREVETRNYEYRHAPLELVEISNRDRGGFVTLGPTLSVTSTANRTSPIRRGVWVMERILGEHFEQPEDVPDLESTRREAEKKKQKLSDQEILKLHSGQPGCSSCHRYIDPIGFGLDVFDPLGIRRSDAAVVPRGEKLSWAPEQTPARFADREWNLKQALEPGKKTAVYFQWSRGRHRLDVRNVRLINNGRILEDKHHGFTGSRNRDNVWYFQLPVDAPPTGWKLVANVKGDGGTDSRGTITIANPETTTAAFQLPDGSGFTTPAELKKRLLEHYREPIVDNAIRRVLAYALGRRIRPIDRPAIRKIAESLAEADFRLNHLIEEVVLSFPFRHKEF